MDSSCIALNIVSLRTPCQTAKWKCGFSVPKPWCTKYTLVQFLGLLTMQPFIIKNGDMVGRGRQGYRTHLRPCTYIQDTMFNTFQSIKHAVFRDQDVSYTGYPEHSIIYPGRFLCNQFSGPFFFSLLKVAFVGSILRGPNFIRLDFGLFVVYVRFRR